jgi:hypothetical protein
LSPPPHADSETVLRYFKTFKESIPPGYIGWPASTTTWFLAPIECSKIPALIKYLFHVK